MDGKNYENEEFIKDQENKFYNFEQKINEQNNEDLNYEMDKILKRIMKIKK